VQSFTDKTGAPGLILIHQPQGSCTYTEPAVVGTFASFDAGSSTYVSLRDERDNKVYPVVKIGGRWIMARNLDYQKNMAWRNSSSSPSTGSGSNMALIGSFWCPGTGSISSSVTCEVYGALYSWETAMVLDGVGTWVTTDDKYTSLASAGTYNHGRATANGATGSGRGICPEHWHVPTDAEWGLFLDAVEGSGSSHSHVSTIAWVGANAGKFSKAACTGTATDSAPLWINHDNRGTDDYGFRVLPAGYRFHDGNSFNLRGSAALFWSSSPYSSSTAHDLQFDYNNATVNHTVNTRSYGRSVRCMKD
jgi:uncharacterized protein (TIGR02145 family)